MEKSNLELITRRRFCSILSLYVIRYEYGVSWVCMASLRASLHDLCLYKRASEFVK